MNSKKQTQKLTLTAVFAALIFLFTFFIKIPVATGYIHLGDALLYTVAALIGGPYGLLAGALGEVLADIASGYIIYAPATFFIKLLMALPFCMFKKKTGEGKKLLSLQHFAFTLLGAAETVGGYFLADWIMNPAYAVVNITGNLIQAAGSILVFAVLASVLDRSKWGSSIDF